MGRFEVGTVLVTRHWAVVHQMALRAEALTLDA